MSHHRLGSTYSPLYLDAYIEKEVNVTWFELIAERPPIRYNNGIELPEFNILGIDHSYCDGTYMYAIMDAHRYKIGRLVGR